MSQVSYLDFLASSTGTDISKWDLRKFNKMTDKKKINQIFFEYKNKIESETNKKEVKLDKRKLKVAKVDPTKLVKKLEKNTEKSFERITKLYQKIEEINSIIVDNRKKINKLNKNGETIIEDEVNKIVQQGYWTNPIIEKNILYLNTTNDVILTVNENSGGGKKQINMGKYALAINLKDFRMKILPYENNLSTRYDRCIHPFVSDGHICWGNAYQMESKFRNELNIFKLTNLLYSLLSAYDIHAHPFAPIHDFNESQKFKFGNSHPFEFIHPDVKKKYPNLKANSFDDDDEY